MNEQYVVRFTPEEETTQERLFWDQFIGAVNALAAMSPDIDMREILIDFEKETEEDAMMLVYYYYIQLTVAPDTSDSLENVELFLAHSGLLE